jgi:hypothetical protein
MARTRAKRLPTRAVPSRLSGQLWYRLDEIHRRPTETLSRSTLPHAAHSHQKQTDATQPEWWAFKESRRKPSGICPASMRAKQGNRIEFAWAASQSRGKQATMQERRRAERGLSNVEASTGHKKSPRRPSLSLPGKPVLMWQNDWLVPHKEGMGGMSALSSIQTRAPVKER